MKIALIGAPTSGKSELAEALAKKLDGDYTIIDNYIDDIGKNADLAMGIRATYIGNLYAMLGRVAAERKAQSEGAENLITCGSLIESSIYATLETLNNKSEPKLQRIGAFMTILGLLRQDTWDYDHAFVLSVEEPEDDTVAKAIDDTMFMAVNSFGIYYTPLDAPDTETRVKLVLEEIEKREHASEHFIDGTPAPEEPVG